LRSHLRPFINLFLDVLITALDGAPPRGLCAAVVETLHQRGVIVADLTKPTPRAPNAPHSSESYMGVCVRPGGGPARRIDIKVPLPPRPCDPHFKSGPLLTPEVYPRREFAFAVLYFTGSDHFNRSMRLFAQKKGFTLSDHGLAPALRESRTKFFSGAIIPCDSEEAIFAALGLRYVAPHLREGAVDVVVKKDAAAEPPQG
jgi:DNA polymerase lambda